MTRKRKVSPNEETELKREGNIENELKRGKREDKCLKNEEKSKKSGFFLIHLVIINLDHDSDYDDFKSNTTVEIKKKKHVLQGWKPLETLSHTYYQKYVDNLIRSQKWLFKVEYVKNNIYVLRCAEGVDYRYKRRITIEKEKVDLPENHALKEISN